MAVERQAEFAPNPAMRSVAADHVACGDRLGPTPWPSDGRGDSVDARGQAGEFRSDLYYASQLSDPRAKQPLGLVLSEVQHEAEPRAAARERQAGQASAVGVEAHVPDDLAVRKELLVQAHHGEDFERAGVDADCPRLQGHPVGLIDDARAYPAGQQFRGEYQSGRAGADDQHLAVGVWPDGSESVHAANCGLVGRRGHLKNYVTATYLRAAGLPRGPTRPAGSACESSAW